MLTTQTSLEPHPLTPPNITNTTVIPPSPQNGESCFAIKSTNVMLPDHEKPVEAIILIQDEKILDVVLPSLLDPTTLEKVKAEWQIKDYGDLFIFPGLIDSNVYLHANFGTEWDNITYSTELAASGGVTTIIDNPVMTKPYENGDVYVKSLQERIKLIKEGSKIDFGIYGILEPKTESHVDEMLEAGVLGLKCYMMNPFQNTLGHYQSETFKNILDFLDSHHPDTLLLVHPEIATERELYLTSPCRTVDPELRVHKTHQIKSIEFGGGANKGSYVEDYAKKNDSDDDDDDDQPTINYNSPSKLKGKIKRVKESMETNDLVHSELVSYSFDKQQQEDSDGSNSDVEVMAFDRGFVKSHTLPPVGTNPSGMPEIQIFQKSREERKGKESNGDSEQRYTPAITITPVKKKFLDIQIIKPEEIKTDDEPQLKIQGVPEENREQVIHIESFEARGLSEIPEEFDREEYRKLDSKESQQETPVKENTETQEVQEVQEEVIIAPVPRPKRGGRSRFTTIDESNEEELDKITHFRSEMKQPPKIERDFTISTFEFPIKTGPRHYSEDLCYRTTEDDLSNRRILNPELVSLMGNPRIEVTRENEGSFLGDNTEEDHKSKCVSLDTNLYLDQSPIGVDDSPFGIQTRSLNISPVARKASTPVNSGLLQRRLNSRKSSAGVQGDSTTSSLSSPTCDFKRLNTLNVSKASKGSNNANESKYNQSYRIFLANRPQSWEENAVSHVLGVMRKEMRVRVMFQNLSLASSFYKIRQKKKAEEVFNDKVLGDCSPSYMFFHEKMVKKGETKYKASPPFRNRENKKLIVETLRLGGVNIMSSYHFFVPARFKQIDDGNFRRAFSGLDCLGCSLQAAWTSSYSYQRKNNKKFLEDQEHQKDVVNQILRRIYEAMCSNPAQALKISQKKGTIAKGMDADLVVWDPYSINSNNELNPNHVFSGRKLLGVVHKTYLRGNLIFSKDDGEEICREYVPKFIRI